MITTAISIKDPSNQAIFFKFSVLAVVVFITMSKIEHMVRTF